MGKKLGEFGFSVPGSNDTISVIVTEASDGSWLYQPISDNPNNVHFHDFYDSKTKERTIELRSGYGKATDRYIWRGGSWVKIR